MAIISNLCIILMILAIILIPVTSLVFIILICCKQKLKIVFGFITLGLVCSILPLGIIGYLTDPATWCDHQYEIVKQNNPTCTEKGSVLKTCALCKDNKTEELEVIPHSWEVVEEIPASCTTKGIKTIRCSTCNKSETSTSETLPHSLSTTQTENATCNSPKKIHKKCTNCSHAEVEKIGEPLAHVFETDFIEEASCSHPKQIHKHCINCEFSATDTIGNPLPHKLTIVRTEKATCDTPETIYKQCDNCDHIETETVGEKASHVLLTERTDEATCSRPKQVHKKCKNCTYSITETIGSVVSHNYGKWIVEKEATSETCGTQSKYCSYCQQKITEEIKKISPITISSIKYEIDYLGGVEWKFKIKSNSNKTIKYINIYWDCYNAVDDLIRDSFSGKKSHSIQITGPIEYGKSGTWHNAIRFYNHTYDHMQITKIEVEFMDGTSVKLSDQEYSNIFS